MAKLASSAKTNSIHGDDSIQILIAKKPTRLGDMPSLDIVKHSIFVLNLIFC